MRRQQIQPYLFILGISLLAMGCFNEPNYSNTPEITNVAVFPYKNLAGGTGVGQSRRDSVVITIGFRDGDGNLGNDLPLARADSARYASNGGWGNYRLTTLRLVNNRYEEINLAVNQTLFFPNLAKGRPAGPIEGTLDFNSTFQYGTSFRLYPVKFRIQVRDRDLNVSNVIETDTISLPFQR